ncbi:hypothetical protein KGA66_17350 [Actinocrinis puniceicyclus]|uniref:Uncharacterized protein n=1 Tax=Actinocrinis puniceicyclus TaxID=977794 RepID=A0A8J7WQZ8_9ACTN|nr:hypothetical protein [Actinocrinis puniceicyclus]MBS2964827.1 hypothetical protein [Actinocrinis puniceicyclus]
MNTTLGVLGQGAVGRALAGRLTACSREVHAADRAGREKVYEHEPEVLFLALTRGTECLDQLDALPWAPRTIVDLTTQSPDSADGCARAAAARGIAYHGGGLTGGGRELAAGRGVLLLGAAPDPHGELAALLGDLGRVIGFPHAREAARAKLLHNFVLLTQQWAAALALLEVGPEQAATLVEVLASGTAGRPVRQWSIVRDAAGEPCSTYLARLAAKDLEEIAAGLPALSAAAGPALELLAARLRAAPEAAFTRALLTLTDRALASPQQEA